MHHKEHHGRKGEMEHHKMRAKHKAAHESKMSGMHHGAMMDNKHLNDSHQQGIERVKMRHGELEVGQHGKMGMHGKESNFKRNQGGGGLTPRKA